MRHVVATLAFAVIAGCAAPKVAVKSAAAGSPRSGDARWTLTYPDIAGTLHVAVSADASYVLGCGVEAKLYKIDLRGKVVWTRGLGRCFAGFTQPIAVQRDRIVVALTSEIRKQAGVRVLTFDREGKQLFERQLMGDVDWLTVAATDDRSAVCFTARTQVSLDGTALVSERKGYVAVTFDRGGARIATSVIDPLYDHDARCSYDRDRDLWVTAKWDYAGQVQIDGVPRALDHGAWALRITGARRFLPLYHTPSTWLTVVDDGWVVQQHRRSLAFIDRDGKRRWQVALPEHGCTVNPKVSMASPERLLATLEIFCEERGASSSFADIAIEDRTTNDDDELGQRTLVVDLDTIAMRSRRLFDTNEQLGGAKYLETSAGLLAYGTFSGSLGLGSDRHSRPPRYMCLSTLPEDATTWDSYDSETPSCRAGYYLRTSYPSWSFLALLPLR